MDQAKNSHEFLKQPKKNIYILCSYIKKKKSI